MYLEENTAYIKMDYSLSPEERVKKAEEIVSNTPSDKLTSNYLDKIAEYIAVAGTREENKKDRPVFTKNKLGRINERETSYEGLAGKLENGEDGLYNMITNDKNIIFSPKTDITQEDLNSIPGLKELCAAIAEVEKQFKVAVGNRKASLLHQLIQMRKDQYVLKNFFHQPRYSKNLIKSIAKIDLTENITIDADGHIHNDCIINIFNPAHITLLLNNYAALKMETWDKFDSDMKWLMFDLDNLIDKTLKEKYPMYYDLLIWKIDGKQNIEIQTLIEENYGITHTVEYISALWRKKIPKLIADQAMRDWVIYHFTFEEKGKWKKCSRCGQIKLAHNYFFSKNSTSKDGWYSICKECRNKK